jgi:hypothetical protein
LIISWNFGVVGKVIRNKEVFAMVIPSASDGRVVDICLTLITSKPKFINPSDCEIYSAGVETGRCRITAFIGFWDLG